MDNIDMDMTDYMEKLKVNGEDIEDGTFTIEASDWASQSNIVDVAIADGITTDNSAILDSVFYAHDRFFATFNANSKLPYLGQSFDGNTWKFIYLDTSNMLSIHCGCYGNGKYVIVIFDFTDNKHRIGYSSDATIWNFIDLENSFPSSAYCSSINYGNGVFVAVWSYKTNIIAYSTDGINWTFSTFGEQLPFGTRCCYGKDKFVVIGQNEYNTTLTSYFSYSYDGISWVEGVISETLRSWGLICYGGGKFIISSGYSETPMTTIAYSSDGIIWTEVSVSLDVMSVNSICYTGTHFIIVTYMKKYLYSNDGINWNEADTQVYGRKSVCYGNGKILSCTTDSSNPIRWYNGEIWNLNINNRPSIITDQNKVSLRRFPEDSLNVRYRVTTLNDTSIKNDTKMTNAPHIRNNELYWKTESILSTSKKYKDICYGQIDIDNQGVPIYQYVALSSDNRTIAYSPDGITWTEVTVKETTTSLNRIYSFGYNNFVIIGSGTTYLSSRDGGITWREITISETTRSWRAGVYYVGNYIMIASNSNVFAYSSNGTTWTEGTISETTRAWVDVCSGNRIFVAISSQSDYFAYAKYTGSFSSNPPVWVEILINPDSSIIYYWSLICHGNGKFIAINSGYHYTAQGTISAAGWCRQYAYSTDGIEWTLIDNPRVGLWTSIGYGGGKFVVVLPNGFDDSNKATSLDSLDGINWTPTIMDSTYWGHPLPICYADDSFHILHNVDSDNSTEFVSSYIFKSIF